MDWKGRFLSALISLVMLPVAVAMQDEISTPGGMLVVQQLDNEILGADFVVMLGKKEVIRTKGGDDKSAFSSFPIPRLLKYVGEPIPPFEAVAVFQQFSWGNACNGGPIWFLGIHRDGNFVASNPIDFCGGSKPRVSVTHEAIHVILPALNGQDGSVSSPEEHWRFVQGKVQMDVGTGR